MWAPNRSHCLPGLCNTTAPLVLGAWVASYASITIQSVHRSAPPHALMEPCSQPQTEGPASSVPSLVSALSTRPLCPLDQMTKRSSNPSVWPPPTRAIPPECECWVREGCPCVVCQSRRSRSRVNSATATRNFWTSTWKSVLRVYTPGTVEDRDISRSLQPGQPLLPCNYLCLEEVPLAYSFQNTLLGFLETLLLPGNVQLWRSNSSELLGEVAKGHVHSRLVEISVPLGVAHETSLHCASQAAIFEMVALAPEHLDPPGKHPWPTIPCAP